MSKEFKDLNLKREKIKESIEKCLFTYFDNVEVGDEQNKGGVRRRFDIEIPRGKFFMDFHFNKKGTTTIEAFGGDPEFVEIKKSIARYIKENCLISCSCDDSWFVARNIDKNDFELMMEIFKDSEYRDKNENIDKNENESCCIYKLKGVYGENVTITYYNTKTVMVQGRVLLLFNEVLAAITELMDLEEMPKCYNKLYKLDVDKDAVREKVKVIMRNSYGHFEPKLNKCIHQAVYYSLIKSEMFEYTAIPLTAFRALEGHMKYGLAEFGIYVRGNIGGYYKKDDSEKFVLKDEFAARIDNDYKKTKLEEAYNKYYELRHMLSHWDDLDEDSNIDTTTMIDNLEVAQTYIFDTLRIIDEYYIL